MARENASRPRDGSVADADEDFLAAGRGGRGDERAQGTHGPPLAPDQAAAVGLRYLDVVDGGAAFEALEDADFVGAVGEPADDGFDEALHRSLAQAAGAAGAASGRSMRDRTVGETLAPLAIHTRARSRSSARTGGFTTGSYEPSSSSTSARAVRCESETTMR